MGTLMPSPPVLGIHVIGPNANLIFGHAWLSLNIDGQVTTYGLHNEGRSYQPEGWNGTGTDIKKDLELRLPDVYDPSISRYYELTPDQLKAFENILARDEDWNLGHNCVDWATDVIKEITGEKVNHFPELMRDPLKLEQSLKLLEAREKTSLDHPKIEPEAARPDLMDAFFQGREVTREEWHGNDLSPDHDRGYSIDR